MLDKTYFIWENITGTQLWEKEDERDFQKGRPLKGNGNQTEKERKRGAKAEIHVISWLVRL